MVSTPLDIKLSAKGAAIDVITIEPKGGRTDTYNKYQIWDFIRHETGAVDVNEKQGHTMIT